MKTSLVIPCTPYHFLNSIINVLKAYESGTIKPDEVIVSLSESSKVNKQNISKEDLLYLKKCISGDVFKEFRILSHIGKKTHGPNRQEGFKASTGDIIIYNDADDPPHTQRIEVIKHVFETTDALHVCHWWCHEKCEFKPFSLSDIKIVDSKEINEKMIDPYTHPFYKKGGFGGIFGRVTGGNFAVKREVFEKVRWKDWHELEQSPAEDWLFNYEVAYEFRKSAIVQLDLTKYPGNGDGLWEMLEKKNGIIEKSIAIK